MMRPLTFYLAILALLVLAALPLFASAEPLSLTWKVATQRTDGTPYAAADRGGVKIKYWIANNPSVTKKVSDPKAKVTIDVPPGTYNVQAKSYDKAGVSGPYGTKLVKVVKVVVPKKLAPPNPPSNVK